MHGTAGYMHEAGMQTVEFVASQRWSAQFMSTSQSREDQEHGGSLKTATLMDILRDTRRHSNDFVIGMRISRMSSTVAVWMQTKYLPFVRLWNPHLDYVNLTLGTSASLGGAVHIAPPMAFRAGYIAEQTKVFKDTLNIPVLIAGRINQPQDADLIIKTASSRHVRHDTCLDLRPENAQQSAKQPLE